MTPKDEDSKGPYRAPNSKDGGEWHCWHRARPSWVVVCCKSHNQEPCSHVWIAKHEIEEKAHGGILMGARSVWRQAYNKARRLVVTMESPKEE